MNSPIPRILDANANRAREALRVLEDYARFALNDPDLSFALKSLRHDLASALHPLHLQDAILSRDTPNDVGTPLKTPSELTRESIADVLIAAGKRLSESLRSLEEYAKTTNPDSARTLEQLRYRGYTLEQTLTRILAQSTPANRFAHIRLCILLTDSLCHPSAAGWQNTLDQILKSLPPQTNQTPTPPSLCIQLREKTLPDQDLLHRAKILTQKCRAHNVLSIINDRPDIALLANADGVHLGQTDLPCLQVRNLVGHDLLIGVSTENLPQARQALRDGASYIAVGPMFPTTTKQKPRLAGPPYAQEALAEIPLPIIAIGGITPENLPELTTAGIRSIAICSAIISATNPAAATTHFLQLLS